MLSTRIGRLALLASATLLIIGFRDPSAVAAESAFGDPPFALGRESCGQYLSDIASDQSLQQLYDAWLSGYIKVVGDQFDGSEMLIAEPELGGAIAWVKNYCRERAADSYLMAAVRLLAAREREQSLETIRRRAPI